MRYLAFILPLFLQHYLFLFIWFSIFQVQGFPQISQSLYPTIFKNETLEHWLEALSIWEMLVWCELLCRSIRMGSLKGKLRISVSFQCHIFHHRLAIFPRKDSSSVLPGGWKSSFLDFLENKCGMLSPKLICIHSFNPLLLVQTPEPQTNWYSSMQTIYFMSIWKWTIALWQLRKGNFWDAAWI